MQGANGYGSYGNGHQAAGNGYGQSNAYPEPRGGNFDLSADEYRRQHDLTVMGDNVPEPFQTFESAGFTQDILDEVALEGAAAPRHRLQHCCC